MATLEKKEKTNWYRVCHLLTDVGKDLLLLVFKNNLKHKSLREFLADKRQTISNHLDNEWIHFYQFELLYPAPPNSANEAEWDITLVCYLIRHFIYIVDEEQQKHIENIRRLRNQLYHNAEMKLNEKRYKILRQSVSFTLTKFAKSLMGESQQSDIQKKIDSIEKEAVVDVVAMRQLMQSWKDMDISLSGEMREVKESVNKNQESLEVIADNQKAMTKTVKETQKSVELIEQRQTELLDITKHQLPSQGDSVTGSLHTDMEPTPGCSTSIPVSRKRKAEDNSPLSHKSKKTAAYDCFPKCETGAPGTSKSEAEEGLGTFPDIKLVQRDLINFYRQTIVKSPLTIQGSSCQTDISNIYAEPDMEKVDHTALTAKMYAKKTKQISYKEIFSGKRHREIYVCGDVGVGKTSFCKSLVSAWCSAHDGKGIVSSREDSDKKGSIVSSSEKSEDESNKVSSSGDLDDDNSKVADRGDSDDERERMSAVKQFKILFYISLMHATIYSNIKDMVLSQLLDHMSSPYGMKNSRYVLDMILLYYSEECLFILDGLEAWTPPSTSKTPSNNGTPDRNPTHAYCVLTTSLPWKLEKLRLSGREIDLQIRLNGVRSRETFGSKLIEAFNNVTKNKLKTYQNFEEEMALNTCLEDLQEVPIILKHLLCLWYNDEGIGLSMTEIYMKILDLLFKLKEGQKKVEPLDISADQQGTFIQSLPFEGLSRCKRHEQLFLSLGKLAFDTLFQEGKTLLVFEEDELSSYDISDKNIKTSLKVGIVSQNIVPNMTSQRKGISFLHRSFHELFAAMFLASKSASDRDLVERVRSKCQSISDLQGIKNMLMFLSCMCKTLVSELAECLVNAVNDSVVVFARTSISRVYLRDVPFLCWVQNTFTKICYESSHHGKHLKLPVPVIVLIKENSKHLRSILYQCFQEFPSQVKSFSCIGNSLDELAEFGTERSNDNRVLLDISKCCNLMMFRCINDVDAPVVLTLKIDANQLLVLSLKNVSLPHLNNIIRTAINLETLELEKVKFCEHPYNQTCSCTLFLDLTNCQKVARLQVKNTSLTRLTLNDKIHTLGLSSISFPHETWKELMISISNTSALTTLKLSRVQCQGQCGAGPCRFDLNMSNHTQCHTIILKHMTLGSVILGKLISNVILKEIKMVHSELCSLFNSLSNYTYLKTLVLGIACIAHASPAECDAMLKLANQTILQLVIYKDIKISGNPNANVLILNYHDEDKVGYHAPMFLWKMTNLLFYMEDLTNDLIKMRQFWISLKQLRSNAIQKST